MQSDYSWVTEDMFYEKLSDIVDQGKASDLLIIPGVYEVVREDMNNEVLKHLGSRASTAAFDRKMRELVDQDLASQLLSIPGAYEPISEHFNNDVLTELGRERVAARSHRRSRS